MRILIAHSFYRRPGGEDAYVRRQVQLLQGRHDVALVARENADLPVAVRTAAEMVYSPRRQHEVEAAIENFHPDVIHLHNAYPGWGSAVHTAARSRGTALVMTVHNLRLRCPNGVMFTEGEICRRCERGAYYNATLHRCFESRRQSIAYASALWLHRFVQKIEDDVSLFVSPSVFLARRLTEWGLHPVEHIPFPVDVPADFRSDVGKYGVFIGRLSFEKGLQILLPALAAAGDPPFRIAGDGPRSADLHRQAHDLGLRNVEFLGWIDGPDKAVLLRDARYLVVPSVSEENSPLSALEAMSYGRPLIVTRRGGLPEIADGGRGLIAEPESISSLAQRIGQLTNDDGTCRQMGLAGRVFASEILTNDNHLDLLDRAYERAAS